MVEVDVALEQTHASVPRPAVPVAVAHSVLVVGLGVINEVALYKVPDLLAVKLEDNVDAVQSARIDLYQMTFFLDEM